MTDHNGWDLVAQQRKAFATLIEGLEDEAEHPTLCGDWTVHQVAAHLTMFTNVGFPRFLANMVRSGFNYDAMADRLAKRFAATRPLNAIASDLRENAAKQSALPGFPPELTLSDVTIHRQDIRRPLGLGVDLDPDVAQTVLDFLTGHKQAKAIFDPERLEGIRLVSTDLDWAYGSGAAVEGPAEALIMAVAGRPVAADLTGEGLSGLLAT